MATFYPHDGARPAANKDVRVTVMGLAPFVNTTWTSDNTRVKLLKPDPLLTDSTGSATNIMRCDDQGRDPIIATITVTPEGGTAATAHYTFEIFTLTGFFSTGWAQRSYGGAVDPNAPSEIVTVETKVTALKEWVPAHATPQMSADSDNLQFFNASSDMLVGPLQKKDGHYAVVSNELGDIKLKVGAITPGIYSFVLGPTDANEFPGHLVFIDPHAGGELEHTGIGKSGKLDLDNYYGNTIAVQIPDDVLTKHSQFNPDTPVVVVRAPREGNNPPLQPIGRIHTVRELIDGVGYSKTLFPDGSYYIYHMVFDAASGFAAQSDFYKITVTGNSDVEPDPNGALPPPDVRVFGSAISQTSIIGPLHVGIPKYDGMAVGDVVTLDIFIAAWDTAGNKKVAHLPYPQPIVSGIQQFLIQIPAEDITNYCADPATGKSGVIQFQYTVVGRTGSSASRIRKMSINTGPIVS